MPIFPSADCPWLDDTMLVATIHALELPELHSLVLWEVESELSKLLEELPTFSYLLPFLHGVSP